jgi:hypothetical protein
MRHKIYPDVPVVFVQELDRYAWHNVPSVAMKTMIEHLRTIINYLPQKNANWTWTGEIPKIILSAQSGIPQEVFDILNLCDWREVSRPMLEMIVERSREYFAQNGVPLWQAVKQAA